MPIDPRFTGDAGKPLDPRFDAKFKSGTTSEGWLSSKYYSPDNMGHVITGIKWPFKLQSGKVVLSHDENHITDSIKQIIGTNKGEYLMKPNFGCDIYQRVFDPVNVVALVTGDIKSALKKHEPRVEFVKAEADLSDSHLGKVLVNLDIRIKGTNNTMNVNMSVRK